MLGHASMRLRQLCRSAISGGHGTAQPASVKPDAAVASTVTVVPAAQLSEQWKPQEIPSGLLVTVPLPAPVIETLGRWSEATNVAVADLAASIVCESNFLRKLQRAGGPPDSGSRLSERTFELLETAFPHPARGPLRA